MAANDPLTTAPAVSTQVPTGVIPTGVSGVTAVPIAIIWDKDYVDANSNTGGWRPLYGIEGAGLGAVNFNSAGVELFTAGNPGSVKVTSLPGTPAQDGTDATGVTAPTGAVGIRGWLSGLFNLFSGGTAKVQSTIETDNAGLAKDSTLTDGTAMVQVSNFPADQTVTVGTDSVGLAKDATLTDGSAQFKQAGFSAYDSNDGASVSASTSSATVAPAAAFQHLSINNTGSSAIQIKIGSGKLITIQANQSWDAPLSGSTFSHQTASGTTTFDWFTY